MNQASQSIQAHSSNKNNAPNNNQESFEDKTEKFLKSLENTLIKQNNNFLFSFQNILTNVIRKENKAHNEEIKKIITQTIKSQLKNSNNTSEESKELSEKSSLTFTFGKKIKKEPLDSKRKKNVVKKVENAKIEGNEGPLNTNKNSEEMDDKFDQTIRSKLTSGIKYPNYGKSYATFIETKPYNFYYLGNKCNFVYTKKKFN